MLPACTFLPAELGCESASPAESYADPAGWPFDEAKGTSTRPGR